MAQAQASVVAAVRAGEKRLRVEVLPPGLNKMIEGSHAYSEPLLGYVGLSLAAALRGLSVQTIFPSAGTAAGAASSYKRAMGSEVGAHVSLGGFSGAVTRDLIAEGIDFTAKCVDPSQPADVYLLVAPANSRGDAVALAVEQAVAKVPDACFVLLNPDLDDTILSYTFGITISDRVRKFVRQFDTCYYYRGTFQMIRPSNRPLERGCVLHHFGGAWVAHGLCEAAGGFDELGRFDSQPSRQQLAGLSW